MNEFEKLVVEIMKEAEKDGEPVTKEEAEEMARMEIGAKADRRYEQAEDRKPRKPRERKVDEEKKTILSSIKCLIEGMQLNSDEEKNVEMETETALHFTLRGNTYTLKLTKHKPPK